MNTKTRYFVLITSMAMLIFSAQHWDSPSTTLSQSHASKEYTSENRSYSMCFCFAVITPAVWSTLIYNIELCQTVHIFSNT